MQILEYASLNQVMNSDKMLYFDSLYNRISWFKTSNHGQIETTYKINKALIYIPTAFISYSYLCRVFIQICKLRGTN